MKHTYFLATNYLTNRSATQFSSRIGNIFSQVVLKPWNIVVLIAYGHPIETVIFRFICFSSMRSVFKYPYMACFELTYDDSSAAPSMMETTDATTAIWPPSSLGNSPLIIFTGEQKFTFMTACSYCSVASQLRAGNMMPALQRRKSIFFLCSLMLSIKWSTAAKSLRSHNRHSQIPFYFLIYLDTYQNNYFFLSTRMMVEWYCLAISMAISLPMPMQAPTMTTTLSELSLRGLGRLSLAQMWERVMMRAMVNASAAKMEQRVEKLMYRNPIKILQPIQQTTLIHG